jgi:hypothetical protein
MKNYSGRDRNPAYEKMHFSEIVWQIYKKLAVEQDVPVWRLRAAWCYTVKNDQVLKTILFGLKEMNKDYDNAETVVWRREDKGFNGILGIPNGTMIYQNLVTRRIAMPVHRYHRPPSSHHPRTLRILPTSIPKGILLSSLRTKVRTECRSASASTFASCSLHTIPQRKTQDAQVREEVLR